MNPEEIGASHQIIDLIPDFVCSLLRLIYMVPAPDVGLPRSCGASERVKELSALPVIQSC